MVSVEPHRNPMVEHEGVPREPSTGTERGGDTLERPAPVGPGREMEQRPERAIDQRCRLGQRELAHVTFVQLELHARLAARARACSSIAGDESIPSTGSPGRLRDGDRDPAVADG